MTTPTRHSLPEAHADAEEPPDRRAGELTARELFRWGLAPADLDADGPGAAPAARAAAIPGSVIPQSGVDSLKTSRWQADHPDLTPIYERLGLFSVYDSAWFAAIYTLLMVSLVAASSRGSSSTGGRCARSRRPPRGTSPGCRCTRRTTPLARPPTCWPTRGRC
jgi:hypothetical protein